MHAIILKSNISALKICETFLWNQSNAPQRHLVGIGVVGLVEPAVGLIDIVFICPKQSQNINFLCFIFI